MEYINTQTLQYPVYEGDIRAEFKAAISWPKGHFSAPAPYAPVTPVAPPTYNPVVERLTRSAQLQNGQWVQVWAVENKYQTQQEADAAQAEHDALQVQALIRSVQERTQQRLDSFAATRLYSGMLSLCTYATSTNPKFAAEGQYGVEVRDQTWATLYAILADVQAGNRPMPSGFEDIEAELPALVWPV